MMAIPIQQGQGGLSSTTILKAANIKTEAGSPGQATIIQRSGQQMMVGNSLNSNIMV